MLNAGKKLRFVTFQARSSSQTPGGGPVDQWTDTFQAWARIQSVSGSENFSAEQFNPETTALVTVDWCPEIAAITPLHRVVDDDGKILDILFINTGERKLDPVIFNCKERVLAVGAAQ